MIKNWGKFNESYSNDEINKISKDLIEISNTGDFRKLDDILDGYFISGIIEPLFKYTEFRYNDISREIREFLTKHIVGSRWTDGLMRNRTHL
jgi:hypothetical protein